MIGLLVWVSTWLEVMGRQDMVVTSCSYTEETPWRNRDVATHLKSWLRSLATLRSLRPHMIHKIKYKYKI